MNAFEKISNEEMMCIDGWRKRKSEKWNGCTGKNCC